MRPVRLRLKNFRSFRDEQTIDFSDLGLFAVIGETGAGKSSILQGVSYALYNRPTFDNDTKQLIYSAENTLTVELEFEANGERHSVERTTSRSAYPPSYHKLSYLDRGDSAPITGATEVNAKIVEILGGLSHESFTRSVLLPQNDFDLLLLAKPGDRLRILKQVLGLSHLDRMREFLARPRQEAQTKILELQAIISHFPADLPERIAAEEVREKESELLANELAVRRSSIVDRERQIIELESVEATRAPIFARLETAGTLRDQDHALREHQEQFAQATREREARLHTLGVDRQSIVAEQLNATRDGLDGVTLSSVTEKIAALRRERAAIVLEQSDLLTESEELTTVLRDSERQAHALPSLEAALAAAREAEKAASEQANAEEARITLAVTAVKAHGEALSKAHLANEKITSEENRLTMAQSSLVGADAALEQAIAEEAQAQLQLRDAERATGIAAHTGHLHAGDICPVCATVLSDAYVAPQPGNEIAANARLAKARAASARIRTDRARAVAEVESAQRDSENANSGSAVAHRTLELSIAELAALNIKPPRSGEHDAQSASLRGQLREIRERAEPFRIAVERAVKEHASAQEGLERDRRAYDDRAERLRRREAALDRRKDECERTRAELPARFRPSEACNADDFTAIGCQLADLRASAERRDETIARIDEQLRTENAAILAAERERVDRIERPLIDLDRKIAELRATIDDLLPPSSSRKTARKTIVAPDDLSIARLVDRASHALLTLKQASVEANRRVAHAREAIAEAFVEANARDLPGLQKAIEDARVASDSARNAISRHREDQTRVAAATKTLASTRPIVASLEAMYALLLDSKFPAYVVNRRQLQLLATASVILRRMTKDRYGFHEDFDVVDIPLGQRRSARTLSGGETFLASLALALALSEITEGGGSAVESLFLDEGFGTLDDDALTSAMSELQRRSATGKLIGIISHVKDVADHVDTVLRVRADILGSTVSVLGAEALAELSERNISEVYSGATAIA